MKRAFAIAALAAAGLAAIATPGFAQLQRRPIVEYTPNWYPPEFRTPQPSREIAFDTPDPNYFKGLPEGTDFGEIAAVATNSKGHVFILSRSNARGNLHGGSATQVFEFDERGNWVRELGHNLYSFGYGHGIRVDKNDDIWIADKGTDMVTKISNKTGKVLMVLGRREELTTGYWRQAAEDRNRPPEEAGFGEPTDVAWDAAGNIYVSDGYVHSRVAKFDPNGNWIGTWGKRGNAKGEFSTVHNIQVDANNHVWVADRGNGRLQVFDTDGNFLKEVILNVPTKAYQPIMGHQYPPPANVLEVAAGKVTNLNYRPGTPDALCIPPTNRNVIFVGDLYPGRVYKIDLNGKVLGWFAHVGKEPGNTGAIHGLACPNENLIYTAEFENWRVQKFVLHPERTVAAE
jgi:DNA-binding beta-propeller fold protein YncE